MPGVQPHHQGCGWMRSPLSTYVPRLKRRTNGVLPQDTAGRLRRGGGGGEKSRQQRCRNEKAEIVMSLGSCTNPDAVNHNSASPRDKGAAAVAGLGLDAVPSPSSDAADWQSGIDGTAHDREQERYLRSGEKM